MTYILYDHGKKIGEISEWVAASQEPIYKNILGKVVLSAPAQVECSFVSPKPVNRKSQLTVIQDEKLEYTLKIKKVNGATFVSALIIGQKNIN